MSTREDVIKKKLALQDSIRSATDPKMKKAMQKRFDKMRIPTHSSTERARTDSMNAKMKMPNVVETIKKRNAALDSAQKIKE